MFMLSTADELVDYLKDFTGSNNTNEIKQCIFQAELAMRNIELPALRSNPYDAQYIGTVGDNSMMEIPADMNKPILFFQQGTDQAEAESYSTTGPWLVYDRVGDRDIITMSLVSQFYLNPVNVPAVIRGKFYITREQMNVSAVAKRCQEYRKAAEAGFPDPLAPIGDDGKLTYKWMDLPHVVSIEISDKYFGGMPWAIVKLDKTLKAQFYKVVEKEYNQFVCHPNGKLPIPVDVPYPVVSGETKYFKGFQ